MIWRTLLQLVLFAALFSSVQPMINSRNLPNEMARCLNRFHKSCTVEDTVGLSILHHCLSEYKWKPSHERTLPINRANQRAVSYGRRLSATVRSKGSAFRRRGKRQTQSNTPVRKEYRMLTDDERTRYHAAIRSLKASNRYDLLSSLHSGDVELSAHFGCHFPGWHRYYLNMYESALQEIDPSVTLPYWDSTLDQYMDDSRESVLFDPDFMGTANGTVVTGPAANWETSTGPLRRNVGVDGELFLYEEITNVTRQRRLRDICSPQGDEGNGLEFHHGDIHLYVGGNMAELETAAEDPLFYMHHANVDRIWEIQRQNARRAGVDVETDYPTEGYGDERQAPDATFGLMAEGMRVRDGVSNSLIEGIYQYEATPTCNGRTLDCGSNKLRCVRYSDGHICIAKTIVEYRRDLASGNGGSSNGNNNNNNNNGNPWSNNNNNPWINGRFPGRTIDNIFGNRIRPPPEIGRWSVRSGSRNPRITWSQDITYPIIDQCSAFEHKPIQNSFCANGKKDVKEWVYFPVRVISQRDPSFSKYESYPVRSGRVRPGSDIYSLNSYTKLESTLAQRPPKCYQKCRSAQTGSGEVFVRTDGISYTGTYKEYVITDQRLPLSVSVAYVAVKSPIHGQTSAVVSAYDSCGRVCHASCMDKKTKKYIPCSGAVDITKKYPLLYSYSLGDSILSLYNFQTGRSSPQINDDKIFLSFFCDYNNDWPWPKALKQRIGATKRWTPPSYRQSTPTGQNVMSKRTSKPKKPTTRSGSTGSAVLNRCDLGGCIINRSGSCNSACAENQYYQCTNSCNRFAQCTNGKYYIQKCYGGHFDPNRMKCRPGRGTCTWRGWRS